MFGEFSSKNQRKYKIKCTIDWLRPETKRSIDRPSWCKRFVWPDSNAARIYIFDRYRRLMCSVILQRQYNTLKPHQKIFNFPHISDVFFFLSFSLFLSLNGPIVLQLNACRSVSRRKCFGRFIFRCHSYRRYAIWLVSFVCVDGKNLCSHM